MEKNPEMNYKEISNCKSLLDVLSCPKGYVFDCGIGCTYSADQATFSKLKHVLGVTCILSSKNPWFCQSKFLGIATGIPW